MALNSLFNFRKKIKHTAKTTPGADLSALFEFLIKEIRHPGNAGNIIQQAKSAGKKQSEELLPLYLLLESHICNFDRHRKYTRESLREIIINKFPDLAQEQNFSILFFQEEQKKVKLGAFFLLQFVQLAGERFGRIKDNLLENKRVVFHDIFLRPHSVEFSRIELEAESLNGSITESYGEALTGKIFEQAYQKTALSFKEFECFPILIGLLPNQVLGREHLHLLNQNQIEQIILEKLREVEKLNKALHTQVEETRKAEALARINDATLSSIISSSLDAIITIDVLGTIIRWNPAATETFGYTEEEVLGRKLYEIIIPERYRHEYQESLGNYLLRYESKILNKRLELSVMRKDGIEIQSEISITTVTDRNEVFFHAFIRDISDRKRREQEILYMKQKAEQAVVAKSEFLSVMSHEIRTPLNSVLGFAHLLLENTPREDQVEFLNVLKYSGENLLSLVNDILDFSKLDAGKAQLESVDFNFRELVENLHKSFLPKALEKNIAITFDYDKKLPGKIKGDSVRIGQVLNNLFSNAVKFTASGSVTLNIDVVKEQETTFTVALSVSDTGIGIPADKQNKIFEVFTQADGSTGRKYGGTGLGLNIAQKIIALMGGELKVKSEEGHGSSFYFTVDVLKADIVAEEVAVKEVADDSAPLKNVRILIAEDHRANSFLAKQFLSKWGAMVCIAENGEEALGQISFQKFDIVLMDLQMPVMDGFECASIIRKSYPDLPILALTASRSEDIEARSFASGMNDVVGKPFKPKELREKILIHLQSKN